MAPLLISIKKLEAAAKPDCLLCRFVTFKNGSPHGHSGSDDLKACLLLYDKCLGDRLARPQPHIKFEEGFCYGYYGLPGKFVKMGFGREIFGSNFNSNIQESSLGLIPKFDSISEVISSRSQIIDSRVTVDNFTTVLGVSDRWNPGVSAINRQPTVVPTPPCDVEERTLESHEKSIGYSETYNPYTEVQRRKLLASTQLQFKSDDQKLILFRITFGEAVW